MSAVTTNKHPEGKKIVWKKPEELYKSVVFGKYIDPNDIKPGKSSSLPFLSILSSLAELELNTKRLLEQQRYNRNNFYLIRLFVNSVWRYVPVDGFLPFVADENLGAVSFPDTDFELSIALIEKAYAKVFGGYEMFCCSEPR